MKLQFLITFLLILLLTFNTIEAKPINKKRGLLKDVTDTVKGVVRLLFHGKGTFFNPAREGGSQGACGPYADETSQIVAMNAAQYGDMSKKSHWCGKKIKICYNKKCTVATVTDACPSCDHGCLDLTPAVWTQLEKDKSKGVLPISWGALDGDNGDEEDERT